MTLMDTGNDAAQEATPMSETEAETVANGEVTETTSEQETTETPAEWLYAEGIPGTGEAPEYFKKDKYGTLAEQAKAYQELEKRFGSFTGAPKNGEYSINLSDEVKELGVDFNEDDPLFTDAVNFAKEAQMSQAGFDKMMNLYALSKVAETEAYEQFRQDQLKALGDNAQARIDNLVNWGRANLPTDLLDGFQEMAVSAQAVRTMEKIVSLTRNAPISPESAKGQSTGVTDEDLRKMQFEKDEFGNRRLAVDPEFRKRFETLSQKVWGSSEHRNIIS